MSGAAWGSRLRKATVYLPDELTAVDDVAEARHVVERYRELGIGLADASIVVLAGRFRTNRVLTLDNRHFRVLQAPAGCAFRILPADG